ncbi:UNVERIFIED_ORG: hypothetical protein OKW15_005615 [Pseudomonas reinekei]|nr:hypothetical protein [Pseudomonas reinekei]
MAATRQRRRQAGLDLLAHGIEEAGHAEEQQEPTAEAIKKREKEPAKNAVQGIERFIVEVAGVFKPDLKRVMKEHAIDNQ